MVVKQHQYHSDEYLDILHEEPSNQLWCNPETISALTDALWHSLPILIYLSVLNQQLFKLLRTAQGQVLCMSCPTSIQPLPLEVLILSSCFNAPACFQLNELGLSQLWTAVYRICAFNAIHFCSKQQAVIIQLCPEHHTQLLPFIHRFCHVRYSIWLVLKKITHTHIYIYIYI